MSERNRISSGIAVPAKMMPTAAAIVPALLVGRCGGGMNPIGDPDCDQHRREDGEPGQGQPQIAPGSRQVVLHARERPKADEQDQPQQNGDSVCHAVQETLRGTGNQGSPCREFERQPDQQNGRRNRARPAVSGSRHPGHKRTGPAVRYKPAPCRPEPAVKAPATTAAPPKTVVSRIGTAQMALGRPCSSARTRA